MQALRSPREQPRRRSLLSQPSQRQMLDLAFEGHTEEVAQEEQPHYHHHQEPAPALEYEMAAMALGSPRAQSPYEADSQSYSHRHRRVSYESMVDELGYDGSAYTDRSHPPSSRDTMHLGPTASSSWQDHSFDGTAATATDRGEDVESALMEAADPELFKAGVIEHSRRLGIDPDTEAELLWIARESLVAKLPPGWFHATATDTGTPYYYNDATGESRWDHPCDDEFRSIVQGMRKRHHDARMSVSDMHTASYYAQGSSTPNGYGGVAAWQEEAPTSHHYHQQQPEQYDPTNRYPQFTTSVSGGDASGVEASSAFHERQYDTDSAYDGQGYTDSTAVASTTAATVISEDDDGGHVEDESADDHSVVVSSGRQQYERRHSRNGPESPARAELEALTSKVAEYEKQIESLERERAQDGSEIVTLKSELQRLTLESDSNKEELRVAVEAGDKKLQETIAEWETKAKDLELQAQQWMDAHASLQQEMQTMQTQLSEDDQGTAHLAQEIETYRKEASKEKDHREAVEKELATLQKAHEQVSDQFRIANDQIEKYKKEAMEQEKILEEQREMMMSSAAASTSAVSVAETQIERLKEKLTKSEEEAKLTQDELATFKKDAELLKRRYAKTLETTKKELQAQLATRDEEVENYKQEVIALNDGLRVVMEDKETVDAKREEESKLNTAKLAEADDQQRTLKRDIRALERELKNQQAISKEREEEFVATKAVVERLEVKVQAQDDLIAAARRAGVEDAEQAAAESIRLIQAEKDRVAELYYQELQTRRKLHNRLMELQGNIRVFCRVRPIQAVEMKTDQSELAVFFREKDSESLDLVVGGGEIGPDGKVNGIGQKHSFEFDHVFQPESTQEQVFAQTKALVTSALDGFNVCIFAYGQTGSGKTHTMEGPENDRGVNFRSLEELFQIRDDRIATGNFECSMKLSILEVYNETVVDLLDKSGPPTNGQERKGLEVRMGKQGVYVDNLIDVEVFDLTDVTDLLTLGRSHRSVGSHDFNEHSSRSHLVLSIVITTSQKGEARKRVSKLHLIDLAGSERVSKTAASGQRLKEAQNINRSLSALGDVISALGGNNKHVPYRNSKLTFLLQESLSGNSKVLMFVNVSPVQWNAWETLCSLNFAARCRNVALGLAKANGGGGGSSGAASPSPSSSSATPTGREASGLSSSSSMVSMTNRMGGPRGPPSVSKGTQRIVYG